MAVNGSSVKTVNNVLAVYAGYSGKAEVRAKSSSGAIFHLLAEFTLSQSGVVYGVAMSEGCRSAEFIRVCEISRLPELFGSKYLQAKTGNVFKSVKADLEDNIVVLFSGTGCQINGLKGYLGKEYHNLFTVDVICHGVPSPALWQKYVEYVERRNGAKLVNVNFRCKDRSWSDFGMKEIDDTYKARYVSKNKDPYMQMFLRNYSLRPSCYHCAAKSVKLSDLTIGDFWGINDVAPDMNDDKGVSLIIVRTDQGRELFEKIKHNIKYKEVLYEDAVKHNTPEYASVHKPEMRDTFYMDMNTVSFEELKRKYIDSRQIPFLKRLKNMIRGFIKRVLRNLGGVNIMAG